MQQSNHTRLMNYIIGMCKPHKEWITHLNDLGYKPYFIEKTIRTVNGSKVKTDVIATSPKLIHSLVFEIKGGITVDQDQLDRYSALDGADLFNWVQLASPNFTSSIFQYDWCVSDFAENHPIVMTQVKSVPILTFSKEKVEKSGQFKHRILNEKFSQPISLIGKYPPTLYYPFGENDAPAYIARFAIQGLFGIARKKARGGPSVLDNDLITREDIMRYIFNPVFAALPSEHQGVLREKIKEAIRWIMDDEGMREAFGVIEQKGGYKLKQPLDKLENATRKFLANLETQSKLPPFFGTN